MNNMEVNQNDILHFCRTDNLSGIHECLEKGTSPNVQNSEGDTPLQVAAAYGFSEVVNILINKGAIIDLPNNYGWTPLMQAARNGHIATVALLLKLKAKVNICNKLGLTPVVAAVYSGSLPTVKLLVEAGAIININPSESQQGDFGLTSLMAASLEGHEDILKFLLEKSADVNQVSPVTGLSPLMLSACEGHERLVRLIVEFGADANAINICGTTALDYAKESGKTEISLFLRNITFPKSKPAFPQFFEDIPVVKIDSPGDSSLFESFNPLFSSHDYTHRSGSGFYSEGTERGKLSISEKVHSKKSHQETKVKEWIGGVAHHLQNKIFTHRSSRLSSKSPNIDPQFGEESMNEVFETQSPTFDESEKEDLKPSILLSPDQYLANTLKEHVVEAVKPPFPLCSYSKVMKGLKAKKELIDAQPKPPVKSLLLPNLLKNFSRKQFEHFSGVSHRSVLSSKGIIYDESHKASKVQNAEYKNSIGLTGKHLDSSEEKYCSSIPYAEARNTQYVIPDNFSTNEFDDLSVLLDKESLEKYAEKFREQEVDLTAFKQLTKDDLNEMGIQNSLSQKKLFELIQKLKNKC